jgi:hypothetical protein
MLGRREEEAEREELERQMREQEEMEMQMERGEELAQQGRLGEEQLIEGADGEDAGQRDLDEDIPDADEGRMQHEQQADEEGEADLDDNIPDADGDDFFPDDDDNVEGETGITDDVEHTNLGIEDVPPRPTVAPRAPPGNRGAQQVDAGQPHVHTVHQAYLRHREQEQIEQNALANAMLDEDEQAFADRDLDADIPDDGEDGLESRDLDDEVPEADEEPGEGEWQHTDTELEEDESGMLLMEDEGDVSMDMSVIDGRRYVTGSTAGNMLATPAAEGSSMIQSPATGETGSGARGWLNRRSLSGRGATRNLFSGIIGRGSVGGGPQTPTLQPQPEEEERGHNQQPLRRRSGRLGLGRENRSARESLD